MKHRPAAGSAPRLRVAYVTMAFPAPSEVFAVQDVRALTEAGARVTVHSLRPRFPECAPLERALKEEGVQSTSNSVRRTLVGVVTGLRSPGLSLWLLAWAVRHTWRTPSHLARSLVLIPRALDVFRSLDAERPDVVHLFWGHYPALVGALVARRMPYCILSVFLGAYDLEWGFGGSAPIGRAADVVWTHAAVNVPLLEEMGISADRIRVVRRGFDLERTRAGSPPARDRLRLISIGRLIESKGFDDVLAAFARVRRRWPQAALILCGDGPDRKRLRARARSLGIESAVEFRGHVESDQVIRELSRSNVMLFLSRKTSERLPNVVKEAMACGCACVVSRSPGIAELVRHGTDGLIVEPGDIVDAADRVDELLADPARADRLRAAARLRIETEFDVRRLMRQYVEHWRSLIPVERFSPGGESGR